jgi:hypothetical protein
MKYRNVRTGRVLERPTTDEWLEASSGWERVDDEPIPEPELDDETESEDDR